MKFDTIKIRYKSNLIQTGFDAVSDKIFLERRINYGVQKSLI